MKSSIKIIVFVGLLLCSMKAWAQDDTANQTMKTIIKALSQGYCDRAQRAYSAWKVLTESTNSSIEGSIKSCQDVKKRQQVIEEQKKQQPTSVTQRFKVGEVTTLIVNDHQITGRVAYLDATQKHGLLLVKKPIYKTNNPKGSQCSGSRMPTKGELSLIYQSRYILGLQDEYWSSGLAKKIGGGGWRFYYTMDFSNGKIRKRDGYENKAYLLCVRDF